jgi:tetratricopeptide (TPR) repeat protein
VAAGLCVGFAASGTSFAQTQTQEAYYNFLLGRHLEGEGDTAGALAALERAANADPKSAEVRAEIAGVQYRQNKPDKAEEAAKLALGLDKNNLEANRILGYIYAQASVNERSGSPARASRARDAVPYLERAAAQAPLDANLNYQLGMMYAESGDSRKAVQAFTRVVDQNPFSTKARMSLAQAQAAVKDLPGAVRTLAYIADDDPTVLGVMGQYQHQAGQLTEAVATFTKALESQPTNRNLKYLRVVTLSELKDYQQAARMAADAQRQHPEDVRFPWLQARALFKNGESARAIALLESSIKTFPKETGLQLELASAYNDSGRDGDAEKLLRQVVATDPSNAPALNHLGYMLARNGRNLDEAITLVNRALKEDPDNGAYLDSLGWAYFKRGDLGEAEKYLDAAVKQMPEDNSEILDHLGDVYAGQGRWQDAINAWNRALKVGDDEINASAVQKKIDDARSKAASKR